MCNTVIVRGGGDIATGCVQKLYRSGFDVVVLETERPTAIRRTVSLSEAVYCGRLTVEDMTAVRATCDEIESVWETGNIPVVVDPMAELISEVKPLAVVDAILAKKNLGTHRRMANVTIGLGPGFNAPEDVDIVVETMRGHNLGRLIFEGAAMANTGVPAEIGGMSSERVIYAPASGELRVFCAIGDIVEKSQLIAEIGGVEVFAPISGTLRGILPHSFEVRTGLKMADIDPRKGIDFSGISDKARCIGGAVLEGVLYKIKKLKRGCGYEAK